MRPLRNSTVTTLCLVAVCATLHWTSLHAAATESSTKPEPTSRTATDLAAMQSDASITGVSELARPETGVFFGFRSATENWDALLNRSRHDKAIANWISAEARRVDRWIARNFERPDFVGGWIHDYVDPNTGIPQKWTPDTAAPAEGASDRAKRFLGAWVAFGRGYNVRQMHAAARIYRVTGERKYAEWAATQLDFYAENYSKWPLQTKDGKSRLYAQGLDEAVDAFALLDVARLLSHYASESRQSNWKNNLFLPMAANLPPSMAPMSNIGLWHHAAIAAIAMRFRDDALLDQALNSPIGIRKVLAFGVTADNVWIEGTFGYNYYVTNVLSQLLVQADLEGYGARFDVERNAALRLLLGPLLFRFDNNTLPNPADSTSRFNPTDATIHWQLYRTVPTYWGRKRARDRLTWESLLDPSPPVPSIPPALPQQITRNFPAIRYAVLRAGQWQAFVHYGQVHGHHAQHEMTNYELHLEDAPITMDPGTVRYGSPYHKGYFAQGPANNVPLVDGAGQLIWAPGTLRSFSEDSNHLIVEQAKYQKDAKVVREYRLEDSGFTETSTITVPSGQKRRLGVVFNTACGVSAGSIVRVEPAPLSLPDVKAFSYWSNVKAYLGDKRWTLVLDCGRHRYSYEVTGPQNQRIYIGTAPNTPLPSQRNSVYYETEGAEAQFTARIRRTSQ